jgi:hypothetical protein
MAAPFVTAAELREFMGDGAPTDARASSLVNLASAVIRHHVGQTLSAVATDVVIFGRSSRAVISLPEKPVTAVTEVKVDGAVITDFLWYRSGDLYRLPIRTLWTFDDHVQVTYDHGWAADSEEIEAVKAICLQAASRALSMNKGSEFEEFGRGTTAASGFAPEIILYETERNLLDSLGKVVVG